MIIGEFMMGNIEILYQVGILLILTFKKYYQVTSKFNTNVTFDCSHSQALRQRGGGWGGYSPPHFFAEQFFLLL